MISDIEVIIEKFKKGEMVILVDDEDRENEGDLIVSSQYKYFCRITIVLEKS